MYISHFLFIWSGKLYFDQGKVGDGILKTDYLW